MNVIEFNPWEGEKFLDEKREEIEEKVKSLLGFNGDVQKEVSVKLSENEFNELLSDIVHYSKRVEIADLDCVYKLGDLEFIFEGRYKTGLSLNVYGNLVFREGLFVDLIKVFHGGRMIGQICLKRE